MFEWIRRRVALPALVMAACLAVAGCATSGADEHLTLAQRELRDKSGRFNETVATGAVAGAALGALIGALAGGKNRGGAAAIGAASGAVLGGGAGWYLGTRNETYANREQGLNARIQAARREAYDYQQMASLSDRIRADNEAKIASLDGELKAGTITADQYRRQTSSMREDIRRLQQALENNEKVQVGLRQDASQAPPVVAATLRETQQDLEASRRRISENTDALVRALRSGPSA